MEKYCEEYRTKRLAWLVLLTAQGSSVKCVVVVVYFVSIFSKLSKICRWSHQKSPPQ